MFLILAFLSPALAYEVYGGVDDPSRWAAGAVAMTIRTVSFSAGSGNHAAIEAAVESWDADVLPGTDWGTSWGNNSTSVNVRVHNNMNEIAAMSIEDPAECDIAGTNLRGKEENGIKLKEADIILDADCQWSPTLNWYDIQDDNFNNGIFSTEQTVLHEMGHVAGLDHEKGNYFSAYGPTSAESPDIYDHAVTVTSYQGWPATMADGASAGSVIGDLGFIDRQYVVNEDDREGLRFLYPDASDGDDVAIQSYYTPDEDTLRLADSECRAWVGERSRPSPYTQLIRMDGGEWGCDTPLETAVPEPLPLYPNQTLETTFSLLNLGTTDRSGVAWKVYLSPTDSITSSSTLVATYSSDLNVNIPYERPTDVTIPSSMVSGTYYVIAVMDPANALSELDETNNMAVWNQLVVVSALPACGCSAGGGSIGLAGVVLGLMSMIRRRRR